MENVLHIVSGCSMLAQKEYKRRHDKTCLNSHWALCKKYGVKKYVKGGTNIIEKNTNRCLIIDVACPVANNLILKRNEKLENYSELRLEIARMCDKETLIVPIIIGALGSMPNDLE